MKAYEMGVMVYTTQKKYYEASVFLKDGIRQNPNNDKLKAIQGGLLVMMGNYREALPVLNKAVRDYPEESFLQAALGYSYLAVEKFEMAKDQFQKAIRLEPGREVLHMGLGFACLYLGDRAGALEELRKLDRMEFEYASQLEAVVNDYKDGNIQPRPGILHSNFLEGAVVKSPDGTFLGKILSNSSDPESLLNPSGSYGSANSPKSIFNPDSPYGDKKSEYSAFSDNAGWAPKIYSQDKFVGYLTSNPFIYPRLDPKELRR